MNKICSIIGKVAIFLLIATTIFILQNILIQVVNLGKEDKLNTVQTEKFENLIDNTINAMPIKGLSVAITKENETVYSKQFGKGVDEHTSFILGSTSKSITATATLMMICEYGLSINDYANKYLPWINPEITLLDLLNHTSTDLLN